MVAGSIFGTNHDIVEVLTYSNGKWIAGSSNGDIAYSTDNGITWTKAGITVIVNSIVYSGDKFVAGGIGGKIMYSTNGKTWTVVVDLPFESNFLIRAIAYGGGKFIAVGDSGDIAYSTDGITWTFFDSPLEDMPLTAVVAKATQ